MKALFHKHLKQRCWAVQMQGVALRVFFPLKAYKQKVDVQSSVRITQYISQYLKCFHKCELIWSWDSENLNVLLKSHSWWGLDWDQGRALTTMSRLFVSSRLLQEPVEENRKSSGSLLFQRAILRQSTSFRILWWPWDCLP